MRLDASVVLASSLLFASCAGVRSVQLQPPTPPPPGMIWGYGVERVSGNNAERGRQGAYLKAMDDLLTRGPVLVSKTVQDQTTVLDVRPASRTLESTFRLRASRMLQPSFMDTGVEHGFVWVLVGTTEDDIEHGWRQFVEWRSQKMNQAEKLFSEAKGAERLTFLKASFALLEEAGAQDDPGMLYYQVKTAVEAETARVAQLERLQKDFRKLTDAGQLLAADTVLDQALRSGLDQPAYEQCKMEIGDRRNQATQLISAGDDLFQDQEYKEALERYRGAQRLDRDNPQLPARLAIAERHDREARGQNVRAAFGLIVPAATRAVGEYFAYKREEERRKREEAEKAAEEAKEEARKEESRRRERNESKPHRRPEPRHIEIPQQEPEHVSRRIDVKTDRETVEK